MINFFLRRPIFSISLSILIVVLGLFCSKYLPLAQYPKITPPVVRIIAKYPGASAQILADTVAAQLERSINGIENMIYMFSNSAMPDRVILDVYFEIGTDPDWALSNTQNRVNLVINQLPEETRNQGIIVEKFNPSILLFIGIFDKEIRENQFFLGNYAALNIVDELQRIHGVSSAQIANPRDYAMRIWVKPYRLAQFSLTTGDLVNAVRAQNSIHSIGQIGQEPSPSATQLTIPVVTSGRLSTPAEFEKIILKANEDGSTVLLRDVASVELGSKVYDAFATLNDDSAEGVFIPIYQTSGSNALDVAKKVKEKMVELEKQFPKGISYQIPYDTTRYIQYSIDEAFKTIIEAAVLVFIVIFLFLHTVKGAFIPMIAMVVSMIGTLIGLYLLGYSINTLTLFGMVLAIGIVVDDAIVVVENIEHNMRAHKLSAKDAAEKTMNTVGGPLIAIVLALSSVFIPVAFLGGIPGQFYKQFAFTIVISVILSGFVALTITPALATILFNKLKEPSSFAKKFNHFFEKMTEFYMRGVEWLIERTKTAATIFVLLLVAIGFCFHLAPLGFIPTEDQGGILISAALPDGASLSRVKEVSKQVEEIVSQSPAVQSVICISQYSLVESTLRTNMAAFFVAMKDWSQRKDSKLSAKAVIKDLNEKFSGITEAKVVAVEPPIIPGVGVVGGFDFWVLNPSGGTIDELDKAVSEVVAKAKTNHAFSGFITTIKSNCMVLDLIVDKAKTASLGVKIEDVYSSLQMLLGSVYINDFNKFGKIFQVIAQAEPSARDTVEDIGNIYVRSNSGNMVPLKSLLIPKFSKGPTLVSRFDGIPAALISVIPNAGPETVITQMEKIAQETLPPDMSYSWGGLGFEQKERGGVSPLPILGGLLMLFLTLAALYERWSLPLATLIAVPFAILGALVAILIRGLEIDIYFQIALIALIGLSTKNGILIIEFARVAHKEGKSVIEAVKEAARLRVRAILMTSLTFSFGVLPLVFSSGAGAASRHSVGTGVFGGMLISTFLSLFFIPVFYRWIEEWVEKRKKREINPPKAD